MTRTRSAAGNPSEDAPAPTPAFDRARHDGWTGERQVGFIEALAECACVAEACARVGMSVASAYALRRRPDAQSFRRAWEAALDQAVERLSDAAFARAIHGVARPVFYQGQQVGERRHYDERLTMFILRYRDPVRYGAWLDRHEARRHPEGPALALGLELNHVAWDAARADGGLPPHVRADRGRRVVSPAERAEEEARAAAARAEAAERAEAERHRREYERYLAECDAQLAAAMAAGPADGPAPREPRAGAASRGDVPSTSSTSGGAAGDGVAGDGADDWAGDGAGDGADPDGWGDCWLEDLPPGGGAGDDPRGGGGSWGGGARHGGASPGAGGAGTGGGAFGGRAGQPRVRLAR